MALSKRAKIVLGVLTFGVGYVVYDAMTKDKGTTKKSGSSMTPGTSQTPGSGMPPGSSGPGTARPGRVKPNEPEEGWQARLIARGPEASEACRDDVNVTSYAEAQACILNSTYPEQAPWGGSTEHWKPWMLEARQGVRDLIQDQVNDEIGGWGAPGWQFAVWLLFNRYYVICKDKGDEAAVTKCILKKMYPQEGWPPGANAPAWKKDVHASVLERVKMHLYGPGVRA